MSDATPVVRGEFRARLREVEPGLFRAEYIGELNPAQPNARALPDFHLGTSLPDVKTWVEQMAKSLGYERVVWDALPDDREAPQA